MKMMIMLSIMLSTMFIMLKHPLTMTLLVIMKTITIALITGLMNKTFWFSYIMFMIMIGGMLVIIIYMTSTASNEKFIMNKWIIIIPLIMSSSLLIIKWMPIEISNMDSYNIMLPYMNLSLNKFFNTPMNKITLMIISYLFITLIAIVKITSIKNGPLRQKF